MPQMAPPLYPQCLVTTCAADGTTDNTEGNFLISTVVHLYHIMQRPSCYCLFFKLKVNVHSKWFLNPYSTTGTFCQRE